MSALPRGERIALAATGLFLGLALLLGGVRLWLDDARDDVGRALVLERVDLPAEALELARVRADGSVDVRLRQVALLDRSGDTVAHAPRLAMRFDAASLNGDGPLVFRDVRLERPLLNLVRGTDGEWNLFREVLVLEADGEPVRARGGDDEEARPILLTDVRVADGTVVLATPWTPPDTAAVFSFAPPDPPLARIGGVVMQLRTARGVDARLPSVRFGGEGGWRAEIATADARLTNPDVPLTALAGWIEGEPDGETVRFDLDRLRAGGSTASGAGLFVLSDEAPRYDLTLRADLDLADLAWLRPDLPPEGRARFVVDASPAGPGATAWTVGELEVATYDSRVTGRLTAITSPDAPVRFRDTRVELDPLRLEALERLGVVDSLPVAGSLTGTLESAAGAAGPLVVDVTASLTERGGGGDPSIVTAQGPVTLPAGDEPLRMDGVRVSLIPLRLALLRPFAPPEQRERMRGVAYGEATVSGTLRDLSLSDGLVRYSVDGSPETRVRVRSASVALDPALRYTAELETDPLALGTLTALFPALPFRQAALAGPISVSGSPDGVRFDADLRGAGGGVRVAGTATLGDTPRLDVEGELEAFRAASLLDASVPIDGPLTGTFSARGPMSDLAIRADLASGEGRFALEGRLRSRAGFAPGVELAGDVQNFRLGTVLGRPGLLPSPVSGRVSVRGGGEAPYIFDVDVAGADGAFDVEGRFDAGDVPTYAASGTVRGLNAAVLPGLGMLPPTRLTGTLEVDGRGTTPETLEGTLRFASSGSTVGGQPLERGVAELSARGGVLTVDRFDFAVAGARLTAEGRLGLTRPAGGALDVSFTAADLERLIPLVPPPEPGLPEMDGSVAIGARIAGSLRAPTVAASVRGRGVRWGDRGADVLALQGRATLRDSVWSGSVEGSAEGLRTSPTQRFAGLEIDAELADRVGVFALTLRRDDASDLSASGRVELEGRTPRGIELERFALNTGGSTWTLSGPARILWGGVDGTTVDSLELRRVSSDGTESGFLRVDGRIPPTGDAELRMEAAGLDLGLLVGVAGIDLDLAGRVRLLNAVVEGPVDEPELRVRTEVDSLHYAGFSADFLSLAASYADSVLSVDGGVDVAGRRLALEEVRLPATLTWGGVAPAFEVRGDGPVSGRLVADSLDLAELAAAAPGLRDGAGLLSADVAVSGTADAPRLRGRAALVGGAAFVESLGIRVDDAQARFSLDGNLLRVDTLVFRSGGSLAASGTVRFETLDRPQLFLRAQFRRLQVVDDPDLAELTVSGDLRLAGRMPEPTLTGRLVLDEGTIVIPEIQEEQEIDAIDAGVGQIGADTLPARLIAPAGPLAGLRVSALEVQIGDEVWLESPDARIQIRTDEPVEVTRAAGAQRLFGTVQAVRGIYRLSFGSFITREFDIRQGQVRFLGSEELNPRLDILAEHRVRVLEGRGSTDLPILVHVTGTLSSPRVELTSETRPPLPESELLSYLVFGRSRDQLGIFEDEGVAEQLLAQELIGGLVATQLEQQLRRLGFVDYVRVRAGAVGGFRSTFADPTSAFGQTALELGWQLSDDVFLTLELAGLLGAVEPTVGIGLDWEVSERLTVRAAREAAQLDPVFRTVGLFGRGPTYQWSVDARRWWEWGLPPRNDPAEELDLPPEGPVPADPPPPETTPDPPNGMDAGANRSQDESASNDDESEDVAGERGKEDDGPSVAGASNDASAAGEGGGAGSPSPERGADGGDAGGEENGGGA